MRTLWAFGIDPGASGGIVVGELSRDKLTVREAHKMPEDQSKLVELLDSACSKCSCAAIEAIPKFCGVELSAARISTLFGNAGFCEGFILARGVELTRYAPLRWMNAISRDETRSRLRPERKAQLKDFAQRKFPDTKWTYATCDAVLILEAFRLFHFGLKS